MKCSGPTSRCIVCAATMCDHLSCMLCAAACTAVQLRAQLRSRLQSKDSQSAPAFTLDMSPILSLQDVWSLGAQVERTLEQLPRCLEEISLTGIYAVSGTTSPVFMRLEAASLPC